jgi:hypothetical protein
MAGVLYKSAPPAIIPISRLGHKSSISSIASELEHRGPGPDPGPHFAQSQITTQRPGARTLPVGIREPPGVGPVGELVA